jgi:hypothetical protein
MAVVGIIFLVLIGLVLLVGLLVFVRAFPDLQRYRRIRNM